VKITLHPNYKKSFKSRILRNKKLVQKTTDRTKLFVSDATNPLLKDHGLTGAKRRLRGFWITGDIRIVYVRKSRDEVIFLDIGSHNQVY